MECEHFVILITSITVFLDLQVTLIDHKPNQNKEFHLYDLLGSCETFLLKKNKGEYPQPPPINLLCDCLFTYHLKNMFTHWQQYD